MKTQYLYRIVRRILSVSSQYSNLFHIVIFHIILYVFGYTIIFYLVNLRIVLIIWFT